MKVTISFFNLGLSIASFAFWRMEGPYGLNIDEDGKLLSRSPHLRETPQTEMEKTQFIKPLHNKVCSFSPPDSRTLYDYIYLYDNQTGYSIGYKSLFKEDLDYKVKFLKAKHLDFLFPKLSTKVDWCPTKTFYLSDVRYDNFYFCKEQPGIVQTSITKSNVGAKLCYLLQNDKMRNYSELKHNFYELESEFKGKNLSQDDLNDALNYLRKKKNIPTVNFTSIVFEQNFTTQSEVEVINFAGGVTIKRGNEVLDFKKALLDYYNYDWNKLTDLAGELAHSPNRAIEKFRVIPNVLKHELQLLKNSTILYVYAVIKDDDSGCIIWGAARDDTTEKKERYHWMTKLDYDISFLFSKHIERSF